MAHQLPDITKNFPEWYQEVVYKAELADHSPVRGSMVIRPYGYAMWEQIRGTLDAKIKATGHQNAAFPLFIPMSFLQKEAKHVEGFSPELAVVTHAGGKELEEPLVVRPTSETIIHFMFAKWIKSWRDLPMKINQWANVVRWELRSRPFLRTTEFFWQEGHTAHETEQEAQEETLTMLREYVDVIENYLAIPAIPGIKSESEKFAGADRTYTVETMMQDGKALQLCTSHRISQSFAHAFEMQFQDRNGNLAYPYLTSWGMTTRTIGAAVMVHGDQKGLVLPPKIAPYQVVIIPIYKKGIDPLLLQEKAQELARNLRAVNVRAHIDLDDATSPGAKFYEWELKGVPLRMEVGPRDIEHQQAVLVSRLTGDKEIVPFAALTTHVPAKLDALQKDMLQKARVKLQGMWHQADKLSEFGNTLADNGGLYQVGWCGEHACEELLKEYKASIRCLREDKQHADCFGCNKKSVTDIVVAKSY